MAYIFLPPWVGIKKRSRSRQKITTKKQGRGQPFDQPRPISGITLLRSSSEGRFMDRPGGRPGGCLIQPGAADQSHQRLDRKQPLLCPPTTFILPKVALPKRLPASQFVACLTGCQLPLCPLSDSLPLHSLCQKPIISRSSASNRFASNDLRKKHRSSHCQRPRSDRLAMRQLSHCWTFAERFGTEVSGLSFDC